MLSLSDVHTQSWMFGFAIQVIIHGTAPDFLSVSPSHLLSHPLYPSVGDDDSFPVVALEWDTESSEGEAVFSTGIHFFPRTYLISATFDKTSKVCTSICCSDDCIFFPSLSECDCLLFSARS